MVLRSPTGACGAAAAGSYVAVLLQEIVDFNIGTVVIYETSAPELWQKHIQREIAQVNTAAQPYTAALRMIRILQCVLTPTTPLPLVASSRSLEMLLPPGAPAHR